MAWLFLTRRRTAMRHCSNRDTCRYSWSRGIDVATSIFFCMLHLHGIPCLYSRIVKPIGFSCVLQLLGRSIDLNRLITQRISAAMYKSLDHAISRFESEDLTSIVVGSQTRGRCCKTQQAECDKTFLSPCFRSWSGCLRSIGWPTDYCPSTWPWTALMPCSVRPTTMCRPPTGGSRFTSSGSSTLIFSPTTATTDPLTGQFSGPCLWETILCFGFKCFFLLFSFLALYAQQFPSPKSLKGTSQPMCSLTTCMGPRYWTLFLSVVGPCGKRNLFNGSFLSSQPLNIAYSHIYSSYRNFVGPPHFKTICRLLGYQGIAVVMEELLKIVKSLVLILIFFPIASVKLHFLPP